ncbi:MAG: hypothetical protein M4579_003385 [Chaenotheca gracillima]|nr:MAG: hypothetical protein M4579_003385 [Chaenotheca gracillima]
MYGSISSLGLLCLLGLGNVHAQGPPTNPVPTPPTFAPASLSVNPSIGPEASATAIPSGFDPPSLRGDNGTNGPAIEVVHYFNDQWPIGIAVSKQGRIFVCYTGNPKYTLGEVSNLTGEVPYPNQEMNSPPGGRGASLAGYTFGSNSTDHFVNVQAMYFDPMDRLWVLDTGRPTLDNETAYAQVGGPKIIVMDITNNSVIQTFTLTPDCHYPDSYMNDIRLDFNPDITPSGKGLAYIVDSSDEGRNGFILLDLGTGQCWRRLTKHPSTLNVYNAVPAYNGIPFYDRTPGMYVRALPEGLDGIALSSDGSMLYYAPLTSYYLYAVPTELLRVRNEDSAYAEWNASNYVQNLGQKGSMTNGFDSDSNDVIYMSAPQTNSILQYRPKISPIVESFVRDPRLLWTDTMTIGFDGYLYGDATQLFDQAVWNNGTDYRNYPGFIYRVKLAQNGTKQLLQ